MIHYVCPHCKGVATHQKVCETKDCACKGEQLKECHCQDGQHEEVKK